MKVATIKREPTPAERLERAIGIDLADECFRRLIDSLPDRGAARSAALRRMNRLTAALLAEHGGAGQLHGMLAGSAAVADPAYRVDKPAPTAAEAFFSSKKWKRNEQL